MLGEKDRVAGGFGELLDAGCHVEGVADEGELKFAGAADGSGYYHPGVDPDADAKFRAESLVDQTINQYGGSQCGVGVIRARSFAPPKMPYLVP